MTMATSPSLSSEKKHHHWWLTNKKLIDRYLREARALTATQEHSNVSTAIGLIDAALELSPRLEAALELKARSLLFLRRFGEVADMLKDYIPSYKIGGAQASSGDDDSQTSSGSGEHLLAASVPMNREHAKLLLSDGEKSFRCFSITDLKRKVLAGLSKNSDREGHWRYLVLGNACSHLGLMEDAMVLLQAGRRLATDAFRKESVCWSDDSFAASITAVVNDTPFSELESASHLLSYIKLVLRRKTAAVAALDAGLHAESIRHFSKVLDGRRSVPAAFAVSCLIGRAAAFRAAGRLAEAIADCNRALAIEASSIPALRARADLLEAVGALTECLRDLDHLKLLYDSILRDRKLPGPPWRQQTQVRYRDVPSCLRALSARIQQLRGRVAAGEGCKVDHYALLGVRRGCSRSEIERAHLLLTLKHKPEKSTGFVDRLEFADDYRDLDLIRDEARMSASILFRMMQKGYASIMSSVMEEEAAEKLRLKEAASNKISVASEPKRSIESKVGSEKAVEAVTAAAMAVASPPAFQGVFCRDIAVVGSLLAHRGMPVKYEAVSC